MSHDDMMGVVATEAAEAISGSLQPDCSAAHVRELEALQVEAEEGMRRCAFHGWIEQAEINRKLAAQIADDIQQAKVAQRPS